MNRRKSTVCCALVASVAFTLLAVNSVHAIQYDVVIDASQALPAPDLMGATPSGMADVNVNSLTGDVSVSGTFAGLTGAATAAHIHGLAPATGTAGVLIGLSPDNAAAGNLSGGGTLSAENLAGLLAGQTYINFHTAANGPGEIRGQIVDDDIAVFNVMLDAGQAEPAPTLGGATPSGSATVVVDTSTGDVEISGTYTGTSSDVTAAHLHGLADPGATAGVLIGTSVSGGTDGTFQGMGTLDATNLAGLLEGKTYLNVHTVNNGAGEIRAQVVPEPSSLALALLGMLTLWARCRRK